ncbi:Alpha-Taxilin [Manis pentadactyla]|nr:Alpha-Taxilin [Manis pentadactyla]
MHIILVKGSLWCLVLPPPQAGGRAVVMDVPSGGALGAKWGPSVFLERTPARGKPILSKAQAFWGFGGWHGIPQVSGGGQGSLCTPTRRTLCHNCEITAPINFRSSSSSSPDTKNHSSLPGVTQICMSGAPAPGQPASGKCFRVPHRALTATGPAPP